MIQDAKNRVRILSEALPYIQRFHDKVIVVKYGGNAMTDSDIKRSFARDTVLLKQVGLHPLIVHGGGPSISKTLTKHNINSEFIHGIRVTDNATMEVVDECLAQINRELCDTIAALGGKAISLAHDGHRMVYARKMRISGHPEVDLGRVGEVAGVDDRLKKLAIDSEQIPVVSPVGVDQNNLIYNVNADLAAAGVAAFLQTEKLILMTNTPGVMDAEGNLLATLSADETWKWIESDVIQGGMLPKVRCAFNAVNAGVHAAHIIDGREQHALLLELLTDAGVGTLIAKDAATKTG